MINATAAPNTAAETSAQTNRTWTLKNGA